MKEAYKPIDWDSILRYRRLRDRIFGGFCIFNELGKFAPRMTKEKFLKLQKEVVVEEKRMEGLFQIRVVDLESREVIHSEEVVADGESEALFNSKVKEVLKAKGLTKDDVHIIAKELASVPKREKVKTVKVLGGIFHKHQKDS